MDTICSQRGDLLKTDRIVGIKLLQVCHFLLIENPLLLFEIFLRSNDVLHGAPILCFLPSQHVTLLELVHRSYNLDEFVK